MLDIQSRHEQGDDKDPQLQRRQFGGPVLDIQSRHEQGDYKDPQLQRRQFGGPRPGQRGGQARCVVDQINMCGYESHQEMISRLRSIEQRHPSIAKVTYYDTSYPCPFHLSTYSGWIHWKISAWQTSGILETEWQCK